VKQTKMVEGRSADRSVQTLAYLSRTRAAHQLRCAMMGAFCEAASHMLPGGMD
jgi:hypothetical protein